MKSNDTKNQTLAICFGQFGPYNHARVLALQNAYKGNVVPVQVAEETTTYLWAKSGNPCKEMVSLCRGAVENTSWLRVFSAARECFRSKNVQIAFIPSYWPLEYLALFAAAKSLGIRAVMMNESHAGTERAVGWKKWLKRQIVRRFDAALVGGAPQKRHFASLGIPAEKIFTGYDAVDNAYFAAKADEVRSMEQGAWSREWERGRVTFEEGGSANPSTIDPQLSTAQNLRTTYGLPERYFLSLGRMVEKKNLATLIAAYARYAQGVAVAGEKLKVKGHDVEKHAPVALVFVGSGELEGALREQARALGLRVVDRTEWKGNSREEAQEDKGQETGPPARGTYGSERPCSETRDSLPATRDEGNRGTVFFYGFRQIEENPVFYALADAFILPSLYEEWGLVVNEAMASGLPVIVSLAAGCAEDLVVDEGVKAGASGKGQMPASSEQVGQRANGFIVEPTSADQLAAALTKLASTPGLKELMGARSRERISHWGCDNFASNALRAAEAASGL